MDVIHASDGRVMIYPMGEFKLQLQNEDGPEPVLTFLTLAERTAFLTGVHHGVRSAGGFSRMMADGEEDMDSLANTPGDPRKLN